MPRDFSFVITFDVMDWCALRQDVFAVKSLLSATYREQNQTSKSLEFLSRLRQKLYLMLTCVKLFWKVQRRKEI